ncbi:MAG: tetratricopeptide repeat protein, partial [Myxococcota bacterium]
MSAHRTLSLVLVRFAPGAMLSREALEALAWDGLPVPRTDSALVLFETTPSAVAFADRCLAETSSARLALHRGSVVVRRNPDAHVEQGASRWEPDGLAIAIAARLVGLADPGHVVVTAEIVRDLADTVDTTSHGYWRLKGASEPVEVFGLGDEAGAGPTRIEGKAEPVVWDGRRWIEVRDIPHTLPAEPDAFVGRRRDLTELARRFDAGARHVTVTGTGGSGKTRLVVRFGWARRVSFAGGVWFCDLSEARDATGILSAVGRALDVVLGAHDPVGRIGEVLASRGTCLVILDNVEQVIDDAIAMLRRWLDAAPQARFLVTSRQSFGGPDEPSLALSPLDDDDAIALFASRASAARRDFDLEAHRSDVRTLVRLLDQLPLAIELAAARVRALSPAVLASRMAQRFKLLATPSGGRAARQSTLRATLDWSWELLSPEERIALTHLSVFEGGFGADAVAPVLDLEDAVDLVQELVQRSLVRPVADTPPRFDLLLSVREYAAEKWPSGDDRAAAEARHGDVYAAWGTDDAIAALVMGPEGVERSRRIVEDLDNVVVAVRRAVDAGAAERATRTLFVAWEILDRRGPTELAVQLAESVAAMPDHGQASRAQIDFRRGRMYWRMARHRAAHEAYAHALSGFRRLGESEGASTTLDSIGVLFMEEGDVEQAEDAFLQALEGHRTAGNLHGEAATLNDLGYLRHVQGRLDEAEAYYTTALEQHRANGSLRSEGVLLMNLGTIADGQARFAEARDYYEAALPVLLDTRDRRLEALTLTNLASVMLTTSLDEEPSRSTLESALRLQKLVGDRFYEGLTQLNLATLYGRAGRHAEAEAVLDAAMARFVEAGNPRAEGLALDERGRQLAARGLHDDALGAYGTAIERLETAGDPSSAAMARGGWAQSRAATGDLSGAVAAWDQAETQLRADGHRLRLAELLAGRARFASPEAAEAYRSEAAD